VEKSYQQREPALVYVQAEPGFDPIREDPRYQALLAKMRLPAQAAGSSRVLAGSVHSRKN
jgi:hypothetical protein